MKRIYVERLDRFLEPSEVRILPAVVELLEDLTGREDVTLGLLTGNWREGARVKLSKAGLEGYFELGAFGDDQPDRLGLPPVALERAAAFSGRPWRRDNEHHPWEPWLRRRIPLLIERLRTRRPSEIDGDLAERILALMPPERDVRPFALIHGDPQPANFLLDDRGRVGLIDFGTVMHAPFEIDLVIGQDCFDLLEPGLFMGFST